MFVVRGPLDAEHPLFVGREQELAQVETWIHQASCVGLVLGARQTGKTSFLLRLGRRVRARCAYVYVDLQMIGSGHVDQCFAYIAQEMAEQLGLGGHPDGQPVVSNGADFSAFLRWCALRTPAIRIVVALDEVGALPNELSLRLAHTVRSVFSTRSLKPEFKRYSFILSGAIDMWQLSTGRSSPLWNVSESLYLPDLTREETGTLLGLGLPALAHEQVQSLTHAMFAWTSGHPYWTQLLASKLSLAQQSDYVEAVSALMSGLLDRMPSHLTYILARLDTASEKLWPTLERILQGVQVPYRQSQLHVAELELMGLVANRGGTCTIRNEIYRQTLLTHRPALKPKATPEEVRQDVVVEVRFLPGQPNVLLWQSEAVGALQSSMELPYRSENLPLILRALEAAQFRFSAGGPHFTEPELEQLERLGLYVDLMIAADIDQRVGTRLYQALTADPEAKSALDTARRYATRENRPLCLVLCFPPEATELVRLPWELLWSDRQPLLLNQGKLSSCVRYLDIPHTIPTPLFNKQLRLLVVSPIKGVPDEWHAEERKLLLDALKPLLEEERLTVEYLRPARIGDLSERLIEGPPVDILHFYGHGDELDGQMHLVLDDGRMNANRFAALASYIPLVILYACRSAEVGHASMFTGIAPLLSAEGVSTVVAMQYSVSVRAANRFHRFLYRSLARGESVQTAVSKGRQALFVEFPDSWYLPVVYIRSHEIKPVLLVRT